MAAVGSHVVNRANRLPWLGTVYRVHGPTWRADDPGGSLHGPGRWNVGNGDPDGRAPFPVLYTATSPLLASWEYIRHSDWTSAPAILRRLRATITTLDVDLPSVLDLRDLAPLGLAADDLIGADYVLPQDIAATAYNEGLSGILAPSATGLGRESGDYNVIVFYEPTGAMTTVYGFPTPVLRPRPGIAVRILGSERPVLPPDR